MYRLRPRLTANRRAWLTTLAANGVACRGRGRVGCDCMRLGWTTWLYQRGGARATYHELIGRIRAGEAVDWGEWSVVGEVLTDAGRAALKSCVPRVQVRVEDST